MSSYQPINRYILVLFYSILLIGFYLYYPGLCGPFLLDDIIHFPRINQYGGITSLENLFRFAFEGQGASGRPLSFLSFALNDQYWPSDSWPFKYTNICIHLLNGVIVFALSKELFNLCLKENLGSNLLALVTMALWLFAPIHISTVLYVIQRMTLLSALFVLSGSFCYTKARLSLFSHPRLSLIGMTLSLGIFGSLAVLSKETGGLLVVYILVLETTLFKQFDQNKQPSALLKYWKIAFLYIPIAMMFMYYFIRIDFMQALWERRQFNLTQRLFTESRILFEYLRLILLPKLTGTGVYHDDYPISQGLFNPISTFVSVVGILALLAIALLARKKHPVLTFSIGWFFMGHSMESTFIPLELYFEHRNYLPSLGLYFGLIYYSYKVCIKYKKTKLIFGALLFVYLSVSSVLTHSNSQIWGNIEKLLYLSYVEHSTSLRAGTEFASYALTHGNTETAFTILDDLKKHHPDNVGLDITQLHFHCLKKTVSPAHINKLINDTIKKAPTAEFEYASMATLELMRKEIVNGKCNGVSFNSLLKIYQAFEHNHKFFNDSVTKGLYFYEISAIHALMGNLDQAVKSSDLAFGAYRNVEFPLQQAYWLYTAGLYDDALRYIKIAKSVKPASRYVTIDNSQRINKIEFAIKEAQAKSSQYNNFYQSQ